MYPGPPTRYNDYGPPHGHGHDYYPTHGRPYPDERHRGYDPEPMHPQSYGDGGAPYGAPPRDDRRGAYPEHPPFRGGRDGGRHQGPSGGPPARYGPRPDFDERGPGPRGPNPPPMRGQHHYEKKKD